MIQDHRVLGPPELPTEIPVYHITSLQDWNALGAELFFPDHVPLGLNATLLIKALPKNDPLRLSIQYRKDTVTPFPPNAIPWLKTR